MQFTLFIRRNDIIKSLYMSFISSPATNVVCYRHNLISSLLSIYCLNLCGFMNEAIRPYQTLFKLNNLIGVYYWLISDYMLVVECDCKIGIIWGLWDKYHDPEYFMKHIHYWCLSIIPDNHDNCQFQSSEYKNILWHAVSSLATSVFTNATCSLMDTSSPVVKLESVRTLLRITRLGYRKLYLVSIGPKSHAKMTKKQILMSSWSRFEHCTESLV